MATIIPNGQLYVLSTKACDPTYKNILTITSNQARAEAYVPDAIAQFGNVMPVNKDDGETRQDCIKVNASMESLYSANYIMYQNTNFGNRWFFAFVTDIKPINAAVCIIYFRVDEIATWYDKFTFLPSFVEREHTNNDTPGANLVPENIETGEMVINSKNPTATYYNNADWNPNDTFLLIALSYANSTDLPIFTDLAQSTLAYAIPGGIKQYSGGNLVNGIYQGCLYCFFDLSTGSYDLTKIDEFITDAVADGQVDKIIGMSVVPRWIAKQYLATVVDKTITFKNFWAGNATEKSHTIQVGAPTSAQYSSINFHVPAPTEINGYTPRNKKLLTRQFCYLVVDNNQGKQVEFAYELFPDSSPLFVIWGGISGTSAILELVPESYKMNTTSAVPNRELTLDIDNFPLASFSYSAWQNDQASKRSQKYVEPLVSGMKIGQAAFTGAQSGDTLAAKGVSAIASSAGEVVNQVIEKTQAIAATSDAIRYPNTVKGSAGLDLDVGNGGKDFFFTNMCVMKQFAKKIDGYFDTDGYKTLETKIPNVTGRKYFNYVKTIGAKVQAAAPASASNTIKGTMDSGCTFWHDTAHFGDYSIASQNTIV